MKKKLTLGILTVLALGACTEKEFDHSNLSDEPITFSATVADDWNTTRAAMQQNAAAQVQQLQEGLYLHTVVSPGFEGNREGRAVTRGTQYTGTTLDMPFSVSGYRYGQNEHLTDVTNANFFYNETVTQVNSVWTANGTYTWPADGDKIDFHAYTPIGSATPQDVAGGLQLVFSVKTNVDEQVDLMTAKAEGETFNTTLGHTVDLPFNHALTAVQFVLDANVAPGTIKQIDLVDIVTRGTLHVADGSWTNTSRETFTVKFSDENDEGGISTTNASGFIDAGKELVSATSPLLMIPQTFSEATQGIRVIIDTGGEQPLTLYATLCPEGVPTRWLPGTTVTYKISTSAVNPLRINAVTYPTSWSAASNEFDGIKGDYAEGDKIGVYAIDAEGTVQEDNLPLTRTASGWASDILYTPGYTYFAYYPYQEGGLAHAGLKDGSVVTTAADFFADGIAAWAPADDQSTATKLNAQDLQVGTASIISASTIDLTMTHTMGLTSLTLAQGSIPETRYFKINASGAETEDYVDSDETITVTASTDFTTPSIENINTKMLIDGRKYYYIVNPRNEDITVTGPDEGDEKWSTPNVTLEVTAGNYNNINVNHPKQYYYKGWLYSYQNKYQTFTVPAIGNYRIECWGAASYEKGMVGSGQSTSPDVPGCGGYVRGDIHLETNTTLSVYVGGKGTGTLSSGGGGWNGGGNGVCVTQYYVGGGGGASDIRLTGTNPNTKWNETASLRTRIIVAAGGGAPGQDSQPGHAGGLEGYRASSTNAGSGYGGKQNAGGSPGSDNWQGGRAYSGGFGYGSAGYSHAPGGGSGWYGGAGGTRTTVQDGSAGGGSSFISGHAGCNPINVTTGSHLGAGQTTTINGIEYKFTNIVMIDGAGYNWPSTSTSKGDLLLMPKPLGGNYSSGNGHQGSGYVRIGARFLMTE